MEIHPSYDPTARVWYIEDDSEFASLRDLQAKFPKAVIVGYFPNGAPATDWGPQYGLTMYSELRPKMTHVMSPEANRQRYDQRIALARAARQKSRPPAAPPTASSTGQVYHRAPNARPHTRTYDHSAILDLWYAGRTATEIGAELRINPESVSPIVQAARSKGDDRAVLGSDEGRQRRRVALLGGKPVVEVPAGAEVGVAPAPPVLPDRLQMTNRKREQILERWCRGWSLSEIAQDVGYSLGYVKVVIYDARGARDPRATAAQDPGRIAARMAALRAALPENASADREAA